MMMCNNNNNKSWTWILMMEMARMAEEGVSLKQKP
jgi:hypothetical protein